MNKQNDPLDQRGVKSNGKIGYDEAMSKRPPPPRSSYAKIPPVKNAPDKDGQYEGKDTPLAAAAQLGLLMFAVEAMSGGAQAVFFFVAFVAFVVAAILAVLPKAYQAALVAAGLAAFTFVFFWNALAAA